MRTLQYVRRAAGPAVRPFAGWYSGYRESGGPPGVHQGLPSPWLTLIVTLDEPLHVGAHPDPAAPGGTYETLLGGLHTSPATIVHDGRQSGIQIALSPLAARGLLGLPAGELAAVDLDARDLLGPFVTRLQEQVRAAPDWRSRFAAVDAALAGRLRDASLPAPEIVHAWRLLCRGTVPAAEVAREVGWSGRYLSRRFGTEIGLSPKTLARVARFDRARRRIAGHTGSLAELAAGCGFYDQAHLTRDFTEFTGSPPARWFRNVQDDALSGAAHSLV